MKRDWYSIIKRNLEIEHEREVAINDLIEWNHFEIKDAQGPYKIKIGVQETRIIFNIDTENSAETIVISIILSPFRSIIRDYFLICEGYFDALKTGNLPRIEAIDMSRRGLHNEGADLLVSLTQDKIIMDSETARRLFTLICSLHLK